MPPGTALAYRWKGLTRYAPPVTEPFSTSASVKSAMQLRSKIRWCLRQAAPVSSELRTDGGQCLVSMVTLVTLISIAMFDANSSDSTLVVEAKPSSSRVTFSSCTGGVKLVNSPMVSMYGDGTC
jgi:hypothetical protein